jgi:hypothetical protein
VIDKRAAENAAVPPSFAGTGNRQAPMFYFISM